jgi:hypothetical protein
MVDLENRCGPGTDEGVAASSLRDVSFFLRHLTLRVPGKLGTACVGAVVGVRKGDGETATVVAEFPPPGTPLFPLGAVVPVEFAGEGLSLPFSAQAKTVFWGFNDATFTYVFEIDAATRKSLRSAVDRRSAPRVELADEGPVSVNISPYPRGDGSRGVLDNLSVGGLGIDVTPEVDSVLMEAHEVHVWFELPSDVRPFELVGTTRSRILMADHVRYGIRIEPKLTPDAEEQVARLGEHVARRTSSPAG